MGDVIYRLERPSLGESLGYEVVTEVVLSDGMSGGKFFVKLVENLRDIHMKVHLLQMVKRIYALTIVGKVEMDTESLKYRNLGSHWYHKSELR